MKPLLCIRNERADTLGILPWGLAEAGVELRVFDAFSDRAWPEQSDVGGIVALGGEMNVDQTDRHPFLTEERRYIRDAVEGGLPYLGICLGAQMLARALYAPVFSALVREIGFSPLLPTEAAADDPLLSAYGQHDMVFHWHEDTLELPSGALLLATGERVPVQAYRVGERAWGLQFHLEVDEAELELWFGEAGGGLKDSWGRSADELREEIKLHLADQQARTREVLRRFARVLRDADS